MGRAASLVFLLMAPLGVAGAILAASLLPGRQSAPGPAAAVPWQPVAAVVEQGFIMSRGPRPQPAFDVRNCPSLAEVYDLAPERDEIPAITEPLWVPASEATWLEANSPVLGLRVGGEAHCYPLAVMNWHGLVHDRLGGQALYVLWDPPSGLALARRQWSSSRPLGLAGLGFRGVGLAFERTSGALWDLFVGIPISYPGKPAGFAPDLRPDYQWLPLERMTWAAWRRLHAATRVLAPDPAVAADPRVDPYANAATGPGGAAESYWTSDALLAPDGLRDATGRLRDKEWVVGFLAQGEVWAVPVRRVADAGRPEVTVNTAAGPYRVAFWPDDDRLEVTAPDGTRPPQVRCFWFMWQTRFPGTSIWQQDQQDATAPAH